MYLLGLNAYHAGASACLLRDGELVAAAEEERFRRVKYWAGFPVEAIRFCLAEGGITPHDLDHVAISRDPGAHLHKKILHALRRRPNLGYLKDRLANMARVRDPKAALCQAFGLNPRDLTAEFHNVEHHRAHMASTFFVSPFDRAAVLSVDGMGDFVSTMWGVGQGAGLDVKGEIHFPHSLGYLYTAVSQWLGFPKYGDEGKVMGLAGYGRPVLLDQMRDILHIQREGTFELDLDYFRVVEGVDMTWDEGSPVIGQMFSDKLVNLLGEPRAPAHRSPLTAHHENVAASLQAMLEEAEFSLLDMLQRETGASTLCLAGGVALNSLFNGKIRPRTAFKDIFIQPAAGDAGTALGAALYVYHHVLGRPRAYVMRHAYTGPRFANGRLSRTLSAAGFAYETLGPEELCRRAARLVADGKIVGWFQGAMEWGPRALGNRSILADPRRTDMKDVLNRRIKHREPFRPFAPSVLLEHTADYFDQDYPDPFMLKIYNVRPEKRGEIPAVTHVDGTGRLQTVDHESAPLYHRLISEFAAATDVPVVLNTSFNEDEPIVCRPEEAVDCFRRTHMDALAIGDYLVTKPG